MAEPAGRGSRLWLRLSLAAAVGLGLGMAVLLSSAATGDKLRPELCAGVGVAAVVLIQLVRETATDPQPPPEAAEPPFRPDGDYFAKLRQLERRLEAASRDGSKYDRNVRPVLARLATERLRQQYGINPGSHPVQAREVLGEQLWSLTQAPPTPASPAPSHAELSTLVALIEAL
jgi:hypothetical protein